MEDEAKRKVYKVVKLSPDVPFYLIVGLTGLYYEDKHFQFNGASGLLDNHCDSDTNTLQVFSVFRETNDDGKEVVEFTPLYDKEGNAVFIEWNDDLYETPFMSISHERVDDWRRNKDYGTCVTFTLFKKGWGTWDKTPDEILLEYFRSIDIPTLNEFIKNTN